MKIKIIVMALVLPILGAVGATGTSAQVPGCEGMNTAGKGYACCARVVTKNPRIGQCEKEIAVFRCVGNKNSKYVSPNGCTMPKL